MDQGNLKHYSSFRTDFPESAKSLIDIPSDGARIAGGSTSFDEGFAIASVPEDSEMGFHSHEMEFNTNANSQQAISENFNERKVAGGTLDSIKSEPLVKVESHSLVAPPAYNAINTGSDINITYSQLEENITTLREAINTLKSSWNGETKNNISIINGSWAGTDCAEYTKKLSNMDTKVQNTISALELLCNTYEQARDMVKDNQAKTVSSIISLS